MQRPEWAPGVGAYLIARRHDLADSLPMISTEGLEQLRFEEATSGALVA